MVTILSPNVYPMRLRFVILMTDTRRVNRCIIIIIIIIYTCGHRWHQLQGDGEWIQPTVVIADVTGDADY